MNIFANLTKPLSTMFTLGVIGWIGTLGISAEEVQAAMQDPASVEWSDVGQGAVETGLEFRREVIKVIEGPVADLVYGAKGALIDNADEFAIVIPTYDFNFPTVNIR